MKSLTIIVINNKTVDKMGITKEVMCINILFLTFCIFLYSLNNWNKKWSKKNDAFFSLHDFQFLSLFSIYTNMLLKFSIVNKLLYIQTHCFLLLCQILIHELNLINYFFAFIWEKRIIVEPSRIWLQFIYIIWHHSKCCVWW